MRQLESVRHSCWPVRLALGLPVLAAIALMVPRILSAQFGLFDDSTSISIARETWSGQWDWSQDPGQFGRFRPVYWLAFSLIYRWAGYHASWYFAANLFLLAVTALLLSGIVLRLTDRPLAAGVTGITFVLGGPVIEAAYTLSKPELPQSFFLVASGAILVLGPRTSSGSARVSRVLMASLFVLLAALTKETTGLVLAIALAWLVLAWFAKRMRGEGDAVRILPLPADFLVAAGLGVGSYILGVITLSPSTVSGAGPRANFAFDWAVLIANARIWLDWIVRDWLYLLPLVIAAAYLVIRERKPGHIAGMLGSLVWMGAWFILYLPYRFTPEYYLLPFSLGAAVLTGLLALQVVDATGAARPAKSILARPCAALAAVLILLTIPNNLSNAGIQLSVDKANAAMLEYVAETAPPDGLVLVNIRADIEYLWHVAPMLHMVHNRPDLTVEPFPAASAALAVGDRPTIVVSPLIENVPYPSVRLGLPEVASREWEASLQQELGGRLHLLREVRYGLNLFTVDAPRLICLAVPRLRYCQQPHTPFDTRRFAQGWRVYGVR